MFFTNLIYEDDDNSVLLSTLVNGINSKIFRQDSQYSISKLNVIEMTIDEVFSKIYLPRQGPPIASNKLQPIPKLIGRILAYNICHKTENYNYYFRDLAT